MTYNSILTSTGSFLPEKIVTNKDLEKIVETTHDWIVQRTGIEARHIAGENETTSNMAVKAARQALVNGGYQPDDIDGILVATTTPDKTFPSVAVMVQEELDIPACVAFDLQAVCSGFVYGLMTADSLIKTGQCQRILLIGAEKMSSLLNWDDRTTCVLFGDGAGAVILEAQEGAEKGIIANKVYADGRMKDILCTSGGPSSTGDSGFITMEGREVFRYAVDYMA